MKTLPSPVHRSVSRTAIAMTTTLASLLISPVMAPLQGAEGRTTAILAEHVLPRFSLTHFGPTEAELVTAQANGLAVVDLPAIGSGLQRLAGNHFLSITDRGPTFTRTTPTPGRVFPLPNYTPTLVFFRAGGGDIEIQTLLPIIVDDLGTPATGVSNSATEDSVPFNSPTATVQLPFNPNGIDVEDVHTLPDGNFIVVDEYNPSIAIISDTGRVLKRYTPQGKTLSGAAYPISDSLPAVLTQRRSNRGFESVAVSPDGQTAYTMTQSPLGPTGATAPTRNSRVIRALRLNISDPLNISVSGQFLIRLSEATTYPTGNRPQDLKVSAAAWVSEDKLLLLERSDEIGIGGAKLILVNLASATDVQGMPEATGLTFENVNTDLAALGITVATSTLVYSNLETPELTDFKLEGLAILNQNTVAISNDNDFGIGEPSGASSKLWVIRLSQPLGMY